VIELVIFCVPVTDRHSLKESQLIWIKEERVGRGYSPGRLLMVAIGLDFIATSHPSRDTISRSLFDLK